MQRILVPILGLLGLVLLCVFCIRCHAPRIENDLAEAGRLRLSEAGFDPEILEVDGRDAILAGQIAANNDRDTVVEMIGKLRGMRVVEDRLTVAAPPSVTSAEGRVGAESTAPAESTVSAESTAPAQGTTSAEKTVTGADAGTPVRFALTRSGDAITLAGALPNVTHRDRIVSQARDLWGADNVIDELAVDASVEEPQWLAGLPDALRLFDQRTERGTFSIDGGQLVIGGRVFTESTRVALVAGLESSLVGLPVDDRLEVQPPTSTAELQETLDLAVLEHVVEFEADKATLTPLGRSVLDEIYELLAGQPAVRIEISGHTDHQGSGAYNLDLSRQRARAARDYLIGKGLRRDRFETAGFGETRPVADNDTPEGMQKNRRIEFQVLEDPQ